jgi:hypothetical protein
MTVTPVRNLDNGPCLGGVCAICVGSQAGQSCSGSDRGCLYLFLTGFVLINRLTLFS